MPTWVTPNSRNQSRKASRSAVMVPKCRISWRGFWPGRPMRTQATMLAWWTSRPAARSTITSMALTPRGDRARPRRRRIGRQTLTPVLAGVRTGRDKRRFLDAVREQSFPRDDLPSLDRPSRDRGAIMRPSWHARKAREHFHSRRCAPRALGIFPENDGWGDICQEPFRQSPPDVGAAYMPEKAQNRESLQLFFTASRISACLHNHEVCFLD